MELSCNILIAKIGVLLMCIAAIHMTGFGSTTSDLPKSSSIELESDSDYSIEVDYTNPILVEAFIYKTEGFEMECRKYQINGCELLVFGEPFYPIEKPKERIRGQSNIKTITNSKPNETFIFRSPRDGLSIRKS